MKKNTMTFRDLGQKLRNEGYGTKKSIKKNNLINELKLKKKLKKIREGNNETYLCYTIIIM